RRSTFAVRLVVPFGGRACRSPVPELQLEVAGPSLPCRRREVARAPRALRATCRSSRTTLSDDAADRRRRARRNGRRTPAARRSHRTPSARRRCRGLVLLGPVLEDLRSQGAPALDRVPAGRL